MARRKAGAARDGLNIILVGCGKVGVSLVEKLSQEGHNITVVDRQAAAVSAVTDLYDVSGVVGNGASYRVQQEAGIDEADILISVTASDELNLRAARWPKRPATAPPSPGCAPRITARTRIIRKRNWVWPW